LQRDSINTFLLNGLPKDGIISDKVLSSMESSGYLGTVKHWGISPSKYSEVELSIEKGCGETIEGAYHILESRIERVFLN